MFIPRTLAARQVHPGGRGNLLRAVVVVALLTAALTAILTLDLAPGQVTFTVGQVAPVDVSAPRDGTVTSESETEKARNEAAAKVAPVYVQIAPRQDIASAQLNAFDSLVQRVDDILAGRNNRLLTTEEAISQITQAVGSRLSTDEIATVSGLTRQQWSSLTADARSALDATQSGSVRADEIDTVQQQVRNVITSDLPSRERVIAGDLAASFVMANERVSDALTQQARQDAREAVLPVEVQVQKGETIVRAGEVVTPLAMEKLDYFKLLKPQVGFGTLAGNALLSLLISILLVVFLGRFQPAIWHRNRSLLLFVLALVVSAVAIRVAADRSIWTYAVPTSATVLLIGILLEGYAGAAMAAVLAILTGVMNQGDLQPAVFVLAGGMTSLLAIVRAERLNAFLRAGLFLAITNAIVVVAFGLIDGSDITRIAQLSGAGLVNAFLAVVLAVGSFAMLGNLFGIMTVFQLLELANPSNRLLRRLLLETPGTYHHAVMVGNLGERAAETIGADPLLVRVAAYYHDIGKMKNPLAFIENQAGARNIHDELDAETSARIIAGHIRDGIDLGYENGLPVQIIGFIPQHHGTSVMSYFYGKAVKEAGGRADAVDKTVFRYPGPKPQSREAAILMLADGVEASVRSLDSKDEASIKAMVDRIVDARIEDGQLDDAELTLHNIAQIKDAFVQQLLGMYHSRIKYPDNVLPIDERREAGGRRA